MHTAIINIVIIGQINLFPFNSYLEREKTVFENTGKEWFETKHLKQNMQKHHLVLDLV